MKARTRRTLEMGARVLLFSRLYPDPSRGYANLMAMLEHSLSSGVKLAQQQIDSINQVADTARRKRELLCQMRSAELAHLRSVARVARREAPQLRLKFVLPRGTIPLLVFQHLAHQMLAEAERNKDFMVRYGLADTALQSLRRLLEEFDRAVDLGIDAHRLQVEASAGLDQAGRKVVGIVGRLDPLNHYRFAQAPALLAGWASASHVA